LLGGEDAEIGATAAHCLGLLGGADAVWPLLAALKHEDPSVVGAAEEALWYVWFSEGPAGFDGRVTRAAGLIANERYGAAISILDEVIDDWPETAEAYHQRGLARFLAGDWLGAIADCKRAVGRKPCHFGALAHMGHAHVQLGQVGEALACYRDALAIHPRLEGVESSVEALRGFEAASQLGHLERQVLR
jgi:tetratricopeptide (TPR) repeat protein